MGFSNLLLSLQGLSKNSSPYEKTIYSVTDSDNNWMRMCK